MTGESATAYLFVACLPFGRYAFVEPALDMGETTWLRCHVAMYEWLGGSTPRLVPDNLKTGVTAHPREGEIVPDERYRALADSLLGGGAARQGEKAQGQGQRGEHGVARDHGRDRRDAEPDVPFVYLVKSVFRVGGGAVFLDCDPRRRRPWRSTRGNSGNARSSCM